MLIHTIFTHDFALSRFLHNHANSATEARAPDYISICPTLTTQWLFLVHNYYHIDNTADPRPLNSLEHCIGGTSITKIRPERDSNQVPLSFKPQTDRAVGSSTACNMV